MLNKVDNFSAVSVNKRTNYDIPFQGNKIPEVKNDTVELSNKKSNTGKIVAIAGSAVALAVSALAFIKGKPLEGEEKAFLKRMQDGFGEIISDLKGIFSKNSALQNNTEFELFIRKHLDDLGGLFEAPIKTVKGTMSGDFDKIEGKVVDTVPGFDAVKILKDDDRVKIFKKDGKIARVDVSASDYNYVCTIDKSGNITMQSERYECIFGQSQKMKYFKDKEAKEGLVSAIIRGDGSMDVEYILPDNKKLSKVHFGPTMPGS